MDRTVKGTIAVVIAGLVVAIAVYGTYLPIRKAQSFIATLQSFQATPPSSLADLESRLSGPLDAPSPIGQEELVRNVANSTLGIVQRGLDATSTRELIGFLDGYYEPILSRERGMSFGQDLYLMGAINEIAFAQTGEQSYLTASKRYYEEGERLGPDRPQVLYGLFDIYRAMGDVTNTKRVADKILTNWPTDTRIQASLDQFLNTANASATIKAKK